MHPGSKVRWFDESAITTEESVVVDNAALFLTASSFDKGPEKLTRVSGKAFYELFGSDNRFANHGQAAIQAAAIIDAGGELLVKRIVAEDSTLSNVVFIATVSKSTTQATDDDGNLLYLDEEGNQTTDVTDEIVVADSSTKVKWSAVNIENCYSYEEVIEQAKTLFDIEAGVYPLIVVTDNGRGETGKAVKIATFDELSVSMNKEFYNVSVYEGTTRTESINGTLDNTVYNNTNYGLEEFSAAQVKFYVDTTVFDSYVAAIAEAAGVDENTAKGYDLINCLTVKGVAIDGISVDTDSIDLAADYGVELGGGSNGEFGTSPVDTDAWTQALVDFFSGNYTDEIYDLDEFKIGAVVDANYPYEVKEAIAELVTFREDCVFFRDTRTDATSYVTTVAALKKFETNNKFIANYITWYQIYDPATRRRIKVTMMYDFAQCLVSAFNTGIHVPTAGISNGFILTNPIEGTVNFIPRITPNVNQKQLLDDLRANYAMFQSGQCIVQSLYTSQEAYTQLSYVNNVLAIQNVVRSVRTSCPKKRYTFVDNGDFTDYAEAVNNILAGFKSDFDVLTFAYETDALLSYQKIFYATIKFAFKDWAQTEIFDVYAINNSNYTANATSTANITV